MHFSPTDLQVAIGVVMCRNKSLIQLLNKYGVSCSYDEELSCFTNESKTKSKKQSKSNPSKKTLTGFFNPSILAPVGDIFADMDDVLQAGSQFLIGCYDK